MSLGLVCWGVNALFLLVLARVVQRRLHFQRADLRLITFVFIWIFLTTLMMLVFGLAWWLDPAHLGVASIVGLAVLLVFPATRRDVQDLPSTLRRLWSSLGRWWQQQPRWVRWLLGVSVAVGTARFAFVILVYPPFVWDSLTYHLTNVAAWTQKGAIYLFDTPINRIYSPANYETLTTWFTVFLHDDIVVEASGVTAYVLEILGCYALARGVGISVTSSTLGAAALAFTPSILLTATGTKNDPHMAAYYICLMALLVDLIGQERDSSSPYPLNHVVLAVLIVLIAAGTKTYIAHMLPGLGLALVLLMLPHGFRDQIRRLVSRTFSAWKRSSIGWRVALLILVGAGLFLGGYWNVRNWILMGNPFYPYGVVVEGESMVSGTFSQFHLSFGRMLANLGDIWAKLGDWKGPIQPDLPGTTGWGWFAYGLGIPALAWSVFKNRTVRIVSLGFLVSALAILMSTRPTPWNMRYIIWLPAIFSLGFGYLFDHLPPAYRSQKEILTGVFLFAIIMNVPMTITENLIPMDKVVEMLNEPALHRNSADFGIHVPEEYANALKYVSNTETLGYNVHQNGFVYPLYRADFSQPIIYVPIALDASCGDVIQTMRSRGTRYLLVAPEHTDDRILGLLRSCAAGDTGLRERARGLYVISGK